MPSIEYHYSIEKVERAKRLLAKKKIELEEYARKENASEKYIAKAQEELAVWYDLATEFEEEVTRLGAEAEKAKSNVDEQVQNAYKTGKQHGYNKGYADCKEAYEPNKERTDKEAYRHYKIGAAIAKWPELF